MKKVTKLLLFFSAFFMCACSKNEWDNKLEFSEFKYEDNTITGEVRNLTDDKYDLTITLEIKEAGNIEKEICVLKIDPQETENLDCQTNKYITENYEIKVIDVKFEKKKTWKEMNFQAEQELTDKELEEYFSNIYESHVEIASSIFADGIYGAQSPYLSQITYHDNYVKILYVSGDFSIYLSEEYDIESKELKTMYLNLTTDNTELVDKYRSKYANIKKFEGKFDDKTLEEVLSEITPNGSCYQVKDYCHLYQIDKDSHTFFTTHI